ncbi:hypothetical protein NBRC116583_12300 [Arenicella sp. 4NH20-0111]
MLFEKSRNYTHTQPKISMRLCRALPLLMLLTSCTTTHIPGLDQILFPNSSAKVGPLVTADEQYPVSDETTTPVPDDELLVEPISDSPEALKNDDSVQASRSKAKPESVTQVAVPEVAPTPMLDGDDINAPIENGEPQKLLERKSQQQAPTAMPKETEPMETKIYGGAVSGQVVLIAEGGKALAAGGTLITLTPTSSNGDSQSGSSKTHVIDMEDKEYKPRYSTINAGDQIVFVNKDNIRHNVFSSSGNNAFDLGTYGAGLKRAVTLKESGVVKIYCNIHADMATFVAVGNQGLSAETDDQGRYQISQIPPGTYDMSIWNIRGETKRTVEMRANETLKLVDQIDTNAFKIETHKNKFGGNYSKNATLFEDEFY